MKTNAGRVLDQAGIGYELREYEVDPEDLTAQTVARKVGLPLEQVFKTLVLRGDKHGVLLAVVAGDTEVDLKALARLSDNRRVEMAPLKDVFPLTGYIRGGVTAMACRKDYPVYCDEEILLHEVVSVSAGARGQQILLSPEDYLRVTKANVGPISRR